MGPDLYAGCSSSSYEIAIVTVLFAMHCLLSNRMQVLWSPHSPEAVEAERRAAAAEGAAVGGAAGEDSDDAAAARQARLAELRALRQDPQCGRFAPLC
jgi:hypothetical protein